MIWNGCNYKFSLSFLDLLVVLFDDAFEFFSLALFLFLSKRERSTGERKREVERFEVGKGGFKKSILNIGRHRYLAAASPSSRTSRLILYTQHDINHNTLFQYHHHDRESHKNFSRILYSM